MSTEPVRGDQAGDDYSCPFVVGQRVVCVRDKWRNKRDGGPRPVKGSVYTVSRVGIIPPGTTIIIDDGSLVDIGRKPFINLVGFFAKFHPRHFRPVAPTSMETLRRLTIDPNDVSPSIEEPKRTRRRQNAPTIGGVL